jgi:hypothetical protein
MNKNEALLLGCVMVWASAGSELDEHVPIGAKMPAVFEYCPSEEVTAGSMSTTRRMRELASAGYRPVALVGWDVHSSELGLLIDDSISHDMRSRLAEEAGVIFKTALNQLAMDPSVSKTRYMN